MVFRVANTYTPQIKSRISVAAPSAPPPMTTGGQNITKAPFPHPSTNSTLFSPIYPILSWIFHLLPFFHVLLLPPLEYPPPPRPLAPLLPVPTSCIKSRNVLYLLLSFHYIVVYWFFTAVRQESNKETNCLLNALTLQCAWKLPLLNRIIARRGHPCL